MKILKVVIYDNGKGLPAQITLNGNGLNNIRKRIAALHGEVFFEAANGWYDFKSYNPFKLRRSAGVGMRFFLPMFGLLGFDYGIGFDRYTQAGGLKGAAKFTFMLGQEPE